MSKNRQTWINRCVDYWSERIDSTDLGIEWEDAHERCWRCGYKRRLQRCHIIPKSLGGADDCTNIVPLCHPCHDESPDVIDSQAMWQWIASDHGTIYDTYWALRAIKSMDVDLSSLSFENVDTFKDRVQKRLRQTAFHGGQVGGGLNLKPTSIGWAMKKAMRDTIVKHAMDYVDELAQYEFDEMIAMTVRDIAIGLGYEVKSPLLGVGTARRLLDGEQQREGTAEEVPKKKRQLRASDEQVVTIRRMKAEGAKVAAIARATGLSRPTVYRWL